MIKTVLKGMATLSGFFAPTFVLAAGFGTGLSDLGNAAYGSGASTDPVVIIATLLSVFFGLLGVIFLILIIYAGFLWMTAAGNDSQVKTAKNIMVSAVIGLVILLSAFAISDFVVGTLGVVFTGTGI